MPKAIVSKLAKATEIGKFGIGISFRYRSIGVMKKAINNPSTAQSMPDNSPTENALTFTK